MDDIDRKIAGLVQSDSRRSNAELAREVDVSVSTANERLRRLSRTGAISAWRAILEPRVFGAGLCAFVLLDVRYEGEESLRLTLDRCEEVQEAHHISGGHSYLLKVRVSDTRAMQRFLHQKLKAHPAVVRTETLFVLETVKETTEIAFTPPGRPGNH